MSTTPLVSVIIPTYNRAVFLKEAIESVLRQSYPNYEILVADDGSTDETERYLSRLSTPVRVFRLSHSGYPSIGRNAVLREARGEWIAFLDDDDRWLPEKLAEQMGIAHHDPDMGMIYGNLQLCYEDGSLSDPVFSASTRQAGIIFDALIEDCFIHPSTLMIKKALLEKLGGFDERFNIVEDYDVVLRASFFTSVGYVAAPLVRVRRHAHEISILRRLDIHLNSISVYKKILGEFPLTRKQQFRLRTAMSRRFTHVGLLHKKNGNRMNARRYFVHSLFAFPFQRRAWVELVLSLFS